MTAKVPGLAANDALGGGGALNSNTELSTIIAQAKKAGIPKDIVERAIAKGKGVSPSGDALENITVEAMLPPSVSAIIECQTDNKNRTLSDLRLLLKNVGGTVTPTSHLFERRGHIVFESEEPIDEERIIESMLEAGGIDMKIGEDQRSLSVYTEPSNTTSVARSLVNSSGLKMRSSELVWIARPESCVEVDEVDTSEASAQLPLERIISMGKTSVPHTNR